MTKFPSPVYRGATPLQTRTELHPGGSARYDGAAVGGGSCHDARQPASVAPAGWPIGATATAHAHPSTDLDQSSASVPGPDPDGPCPSAKRTPPEEFSPPCQA